jgi:hypothetical protein
LNLQKASHKLVREKWKAMEFAITGPARVAGSDDSWLPRGARSFLLGAIA